MGESCRRKPWWFDIWRGIHRSAEPRSHTLEGNELIIVDTIFGVGVKVKFDFRSRLVSISRLCCRHGVLVAADALQRRRGEAEEGRR